MEKNIGTLVVIVICVILSAYFSATETAFASLNHIRVKNMAEKGDRRAILVMKLLDRYDSVLSTILVGNNVVNIGATSLATVFFVRMLGEDAGSGIATLVTTLVLLIFGEISPKSMASEFPEQVAMLAAPLLSCIVVVLTPVNFLFGLWKKFLAKLIKGEEDRAITDEELLTIVDEAETGGGIGEEESDLIRNSIEFRDQEAVDILTPRVDIVGVEYGTSNQEIADIFAQTGYSRLPVYREDMDHITGILYEKDFYNKIFGSDRTIDSIIRPTVFITEHKKIDELLRELQKKKIHLAVVVDEYGGTVGIVSMEDILEELVGEIWDEHDEIVQEIRKITDSDYVVEGSANLEKLFDEIGCEREHDSITVSGWILEIAGKVPSRGDVYHYENMTIRILEMDGHRVGKIKLHVEHPAEKEDRADKQ
ncbi:HlyC/CorC family transporter [Bilifractor sp. LCP19S3_H10]|uniref:HlyC/CorC family transporter n=1 Tax=Bilifractor sp. LCP19S3_H10 TaxID=3438736 RepID=UPI003F8FC5F5